VPTDPVLASLHFRVEMAGAAAEQAIAFLSQREVLRGRMAVQSVVFNLTAAASRLRASGQYPDQLSYVEKLIQFYAAKMSAVMRPAVGPAIAAELAANQANLLAAAPI
jgi:hypothetical protein